MAETTFDPIEHKYTIGGREVPGVTEILGDTGLRESFFDKEEAAEKGTKIHLACHFHNKKRLNWETLHPLIYGYVEGYLKFKRECKVVVLESEYVVFNETLQYGTTIDSIDNLEFMGQLTRAVVEIKSGQPQPSDALQTAGQILALTSGGNNYDKCLPSFPSRFVLYLKENGTFKLVENTDYEDFKDFEAACRVYHRKRRLTNV